MKLRVFIVAVLLIFCSSSTCPANPIVPFPSFGGIFAIDTGHAILIDCLADFIALFLAYLVIRKLQILACWKFLAYFGLVVLGGIIIDVVSLCVHAVAITLAFLPPPSLDMLVMFILVGLLLYFYNSSLSKKFFKLENNQARIIGTVLALLTNPVIGSVFLTSIQRWRY